MPFYTTQATIKTTDNVQANFATNTWHVDADDLTELGNFHTALTTFYQAVDGTMSSLVLATGGLALTSYLDTDPTPRYPVLETSANLTVGAGDPLATQLSIVVSFQGDRVSGTPQARQRGRIYLPFPREALNDTSGRPDSTTVSTIATAAGVLLAASAGGGPGWTWVVYSRTAPGYTVVTNGWVDNEWDTQRRRGREYTTRTTF